MKKTAWIVLAIAVLAAALFGAGQEAKPEMKKELVKLNYVRPNDIMMLLHSYLSPQGRINMSSEENMLTISDAPDNIARILGAIKEIDVKPADVQFSVQLVLASEDAADKTEEALAGDPVIKELRSFLKYKSFSLLDTSLVRAIHERRSELTVGRKGEFILNFRPRVIRRDGADDIQIEVELRQVSGLTLMKETSQKENQTVTTERPGTSHQTLIASSLTVKSGEKTVVGVSRTAGGEKGLILIISARII